VLYERLRKRNYAPAKIAENVQAEVLDVILCESAGTDAQVFEIDNTSCAPEQTAATIMDIVAGNADGYRPGTVDRSGEMEKWC
jgi:adenylate kinase